MSNKIVYLDASTIDFGDADFSAISESGEAEIYPFTEPGQTIERIGDAQIIITNKVRIDANVMDSCPNLKMVAIAATGFDVVDVEAAKKRGVAVANVSGYSTESVAQLTFAFILNFATELMKNSASVRAGEWSASPIFTLGSTPTFELHGRTIGIVGAGTIGGRVAEIAQCFGMRVIAYRRPGATYTDGLRRVDLNELAKEADFVSLHTPLNDATRGLVDADFLSKMKPTAYVINMARGQVVDSTALAKALASGQIAGAACDVLNVEPPTDDPLLAEPKCVITPHIGWATRQSRERLIEGIAENIKAFLNGVEKNRLDL